MFLLVITTYNYLYHFLDKVGTKLILSEVKTTKKNKTHFLVFVSKCKAFLIALEIIKKATI